MQCKVSIVVPIYNVEEYLPQCLHSIQSQSFQDYEVIMVDDGSTDSSGAICDSFSEKDKRFRTVHQNNRGQAAARNVGVSLAGGEWICFIDSDDLIAPEYIHLLLDAVINTKCKIASCKENAGEGDPYFTRSAIARTTIINTDEDGLFRLLEDNESTYWVVWGKIIAREIVTTYPFTEGKAFEDNAIVFQWLMKAEKIALLPDSLYYYRVREGSTVHQSFSKKSLDRLWALEEQILVFRNLKYDKMECAITKRLLLAATSTYFEAQKMCSEPEIQRALLNKVRRIYFTNSKRITMNEKEKLFVYEAVFPYAMRLFWLIKGVLNDE